MTFRYVFLLAILSLNFSAGFGYDCQSSLNEIKGKLNTVIEEIHKKPLSFKQIEALIDWSDQFRHDYYVFGAWGTEEVPGTARWALSRLLNSGYFHASALGMSTIRKLGWDEVNRWAHAPNIYWHDGRLNAAFYDYLVNVVDSRDSPEMNQQVIDFANSHKVILEDLFQQEISTNEKDLEKFLKKNAFILFYFIGRLEEELGSSEFIRHKWPTKKGTYGGDQKEMGYYRKVMKAQLKEELLRLKNELDQIEGCTVLAREIPFFQTDSATTDISNLNIAAVVDSPQTELVVPSVFVANDTSPGSFIENPPTSFRTIGGNVGLGLRSENSAFCLGATYQQTIGQPIGNAQLQPVFGGTASLSYDRFSNGSFTNTETWGEVEPHLELRAPGNTVQVLGRLATPIGFGSSTNTNAFQDTLSGSEMRYSLRSFGVNLQGGLVIHFKNTQIIIVTTIIGFRRRTKTYDNNAATRFSSNSFGLRLNKSNNLKVGVQFPIGSE